MTKRILVVDDEGAVRKSFSLALEDTGCQTDTAESGEKGIEKAQTSKYDLVFLDLKMPGLNGVETLRQLRKIDRDVPIYIVTAFHAEFFDQLNKAAKDGLRFEVAEKPLDGDQIALLTKSVLESPVGY